MSEQKAFNPKTVANRILRMKTKLNKLKKQVEQEMNELRHYLEQQEEKVEELGNAKVYTRKSKPMLVSDDADVNIDQVSKVLVRELGYNYSVVPPTKLDLAKIEENMENDTQLRNTMNEYGVKVVRNEEYHIKHL